ncbi:cytochrome P450 [Actinoplanes aureus]|uniref:Cytochrome P450 n=1 Tax=Actinoplanes aureus TaxID=2792083 RepID=A0A931G1Y5_9ACTN|nr:cytochrome P450 [Actinoplanes aureus]MBG0567540.1 cytochrome P450 [Actinoplanes aureus]
MRLDPFSDTYCSDPAKTWKRILGFEGRQVLYDPDLDVWLIAGHDNVRAALTDARRFSNAATLAPLRPPSDAAATILSRFDAPDVLVSADGAQHTRIRAIVRAVFPQASVQVHQVWGALIAEHTSRLVDQLAGHESADLMRVVATRLPLLVIVDILGLPTDGKALPGSADGFASLVWGDFGAFAQRQAAIELVQLWRYCRDSVIARAATPDGGDGLIGELLRHRDGDDARLTLDELAALVLNLIVASWGSTSGALGHALDHALADPHRWARLADDEHYLATHVEESLRHSPVIDGWLRLTTTDVTLDGVTIPAGSRCLLLIGTANHDPRVYATPGRFDPGRAWLSQHLSFGAGPHYCIGAALARLELTTVLRALARRLPHLRLAGGYQRRFRPNVAVRTHISLPATGIAGGCPQGHDARTRSPQ